MFTKLKILPVMALGIFCIGISEGNAARTALNCKGTNQDPSWTLQQCAVAKNKCQELVNTQLKNCKNKNKNKCKIKADVVCKPFMMNLAANSPCQNWTGYSMCVAQVPIVYPTMAANQACDVEGYTICSESFGPTKHKKTQPHSKH